MAVDVATIASMVSLIRYLSQQVERHQNGELTGDELTALWASLQVTRDATKMLWLDAKAKGGY